MLIHRNWTFRIKLSYHQLYELIRRNIVTKFSNRYENCVIVENLYSSWPDTLIKKKIKTMRETRYNRKVYYMQEPITYQRTLTLNNPWLILILKCETKLNNTQSAVPLLVVNRWHLICARPSFKVRGTLLCCCM